MHQVLHGDCIEVMRTLPDNSVDSIVTDPPYGLGFMGKAWDALPPGLEWAEECLRVLKPGGHLLAFGGTRTWHRLAVAVEDAGFEIRDSIAWMYGSGFPKSMDVSKAIDKAGGNPLAFRRFARAYADAVATSALNHSAVDAHLGIKASSCYWAREDHRGGMPPRHHWETVRELLSLPDDLVRLYDEAEREVIGAYGAGLKTGTSGVGGGGEGGDITAPATDAAKQWEGWGTALKPAFEPVVVGRKPFPGTVAANVLTHGTGALNIDASRIHSHDSGARTYTVQRMAPGAVQNATGKTHLEGVAFQGETTAGRWPANVVLDEFTAELLDGQSGVLTSGKWNGNRTTSKTQGIYGDYESAPEKGAAGDSGGASRFFYVAKAPKKERPVVDGVAHATVKPLALMRYLVRLVTPAGGTVLETFAGSGTTVEACILEGLNCIAIEREAELLPLIQVRIDRALLSLMEDLL